MRQFFSLSGFVWLLVFLESYSFSQEMLTASQYFETVYQKYQGFNDLKADVSLDANGSKSVGTLLFKSPSAFRLDFTDRRVFSKKGNKLTVYSPNLNTTFIQSLKTQASNPNPLSILKSEYTVAYVTGPSLEPLEEGSREQVQKLLFRRRILKGATIRQMEIAFTLEGMIRRVIAVTNSGKTMVLDFNNVQINTGLFDPQFDYRAPLTADVVSNFLYDDV